MCLVSRACVKEMNSSFNPVILILSYVILVIIRSIILEIRLLLPDLENDSLEHIWFSCLYYIKRIENYKFFFWNNWENGMWFPNLETYLWKYRFQYIPASTKKIIFIYPTFQIIWKITSINLGIQETNKVN